jgi:hypothetical protein
MEFLVKLDLKVLQDQTVWMERLVSWVDQAQLDPWAQWVPSVPMERMVSLVLTVQLECLDTMVCPDLKDPWDHKVCKGSQALCRPKRDVISLLA